MMTRLQFMGTIVGSAVSAVAGLFTGSKLFKAKGMKTHTRVPRPDVDENGMRDLRCPSCHKSLFRYPSEQFGKAWGRVRCHDCGWKCDRSGEGGFRNKTHLLRPRRRTDYFCLLDRKDGPRLMVKFIYDNFEKEENELLIRHLVEERYSFLFPTWLRTLTVAVYDNPQPNMSETTEAWSEGAPEYGCATISLVSVVFDRTTRRQNEIIAHELVHVCQMRHLNFITKRLLNKVQDVNPDLYVYLEADHMERVEEFTVHMEKMVVNWVERFNYG